MISDWMAFMLSGELAVDPSNAGTTGLWIAVTRNWKRSLLQMAGLRLSTFSRAKEPGRCSVVTFSQKARLNSATCKRVRAGHRWRRRCAD